MTRRSFLAALSALVLAPFRRATPQARIPEGLDLFSPGTLDYKVGHIFGAAVMDHRPLIGLGLDDDEAVVE